VGSILIIGREDDLCCRLVKDRLEATGKRCLFLPENELFPGLTFHWELDKGKARGALGYAPLSEAIPFGQFDGVLARFSGITTSAEGHQTKDGQYLNAEWHALARGYMQSLDCPVVNRLRPELWYKMRLTVPDLLALVPDIRFRLPRTMVTTRVADAREFYSMSPHGMEYSPLSMPSRYPIRDSAELNKLEPLSGYLPLCLTEIIPGESLRAFVVGGQVVFDGPEESGHRQAAEACLDAAGTLGLSFCAFELRRPPDGGWYCLGMECMPDLFAALPETRAAVVENLLIALGAGAARRAA